LKPIKETIKKVVMKRNRNCFQVWIVLNMH